MPNSDCLQAYNTLCDDLVADGLPIKMTKSWGMPTITLNRKIVAGLFDGALIVKLPLDQVDSALEIPGASRFDPMGGRPMKQWVSIPSSSVDLWRGNVDKAIEGMMVGLGDRIVVIPRHRPR